MLTPTLDRTALGIVCLEENWCCSVCRENNSILSDVETLASNNDIFTHYSAAHHTVSWLDHCVTTTSAHNLITDITMCDRYVVSDHLPLRIAVNCDIISISDEYSRIDSCDQIILWNSVTDTDKATYTNKCDELLQKINLPTESLLCRDVNCDVASHKAAISCLYDEIMNCLSQAGLSISKKQLPSQHHNVPGWNEYCRDAHDQARDAFSLVVYSRETPARFYL